MSARALQSRRDMSNFTVRRFLLVASMLFCRVALCDEATSAAPPPEPPFKLLAAQKPVSLEEVDKVIEASDRAVQACNKNPRRADTLAVLMTLTIDADGKVSAVEAAAQDQDGGKMPPEAACLARVARKLKFPAAGTISHVEYPFMLVPHVKRALSF
jgi:ABC-type nitrate/sulfonate/bicarbonate transport system substrate-binding protein